MAKRKGMGRRIRTKKNTLKKRRRSLKYGGGENIIEKLLREIFSVKNIGKLNELFDATLKMYEGLSEEQRKEIKAGFQKASKRAGEQNIKLEQLKEIIAAFQKESKRTDEQNSNKQGGQYGGSETGTNQSLEDCMDSIASLCRQLVDNDIETGVLLGSFAFLLQSGSIIPESISGIINIIPPIGFGYALGSMIIPTLSVLLNQCRGQILALSASVAALYTAFYLNGY